MTRAAPVSGVARAQRYVKAVLSGAIPACKWVKQAARRQQRDLERAKKDKSWPYRFDPDAANHACAFIEQLPHVSGRWAAERKLISLEPWQAFVVTCLFGWVHRVTGKRRFRQGYLQVARKNAKSTLAAGIALYMLRYDGEEGAQVFSGATSLVQAMEVFRPAKLMVDRLAPFTRALALETAAQSVFHRASNSFFKPVVGKPGDGASPHCAIIDEYHEHATSEFYDTMVLGMGAREQPLALVITTAGNSLGGPCHQMAQECQKLLDGVYDDDSIFAVIYTIDAKDDWTDPAVLIKANPNLGVSISREDLEREQAQAARDANKQGAFRTKKLNEWVGARDGYFNMRAWADCAVVGLSLDEFSGKPALIGLDLASFQDLSAVQLFFPPEPERDPATFGFYHLSQQVHDAASSQHYKAWALEGLIEVHSGAMIDHTVVQAQILGLRQRFRLLEVSMDMAQANIMAMNLMAAGVPVTQFVQQAVNYTPPMKQLLGWIDGGRFRHAGNPVMNWMMSNVTAKEDAKEQVFPRKEQPGNKIDGPVALMMAVGAWLRREATPEPPPSPYLKRGILVI
jgi:phage terminase large subunit-like protein